MRITNNTVSDNILRQIQRIGSEQAKLQTQVATGQRITNPDDDPTAMGRVLNLETERRRIGQFTRNADRALELSQATFAALQQMKKVSDRATEIATLGSSPLGPDAMRTYASEVEQLIEQAAQVGNTQFRNDYLFAGNQVAAAPFELDGGTGLYVYQGGGEPAEIQLSDTARVSPGSTDAANQDLRDFMNHLIALRDALAAGDSAALETVKSNLIADEDVIVASLAEHGGIQTRIEANRAQLQARVENIEMLVSAEADADIPSTVVRLNQSQMAYQAALQSAANIMRTSLLDYIR